MARIYIHDVSNNPLAIIPLGEAKIRMGYVRVIHPINLIDISNMIEETIELIPTEVHTESLEKLIQIKAMKLQETFKKVKPFKRQKRWNTIGKVWKWIAGNPDADDLQIINSTLNSLIEENNHQVMINEALNGRLREVTDIANKVLTNEAKRYETYATETRQLIILSNLDILQDQIETIEEAIISAKHEIPNSKLLSTEDLQTINEFLKKNGFDYNTAEELLAQSVAQFMMNTTHVLYMLKFPRISSQIYEYDFIEPIVKNGKRIMLKQNFIIRNGTHEQQRS
ncbi:uncharacterized protein LOC128309301 [Anopheles moucheti]|uniref:uncharacterized protein LOC128309301 n=1 Tax=Anopheles moucheti TaxID=186751 RepID=UPI0022F0CBAF|nr:uncharacterized protein LOC128309301 [Anopheles moucheti]